jgi:hypothetical protein
MEGYILPDDFTRAGELVAYRQEGTEPIFSYRPVTKPHGGKKKATNGWHEYSLLFRSATARA